MEINLPNLCKLTGKIELEFHDGTINFSGTLMCNEDGTIPPIDPPDPPEGVETLFLQQFTESPLTDAYNGFDARRDFGEIRYSNGIGWEDHYNVEIVDVVDAGRLMKINTIADQIGPDYGCMFAKVINETEAWLSYNIRFSPNWESAEGGKLFGLATTEGAGPGGGASNGFSARWMWRPDAKLMYYVYYPDMDTEYGKSFGNFPDPDDPSQDFSFYNDGVPKWFNFTLRVKLNSAVDSTDGFIEAFIDGKLVQSVTGLRLRGDLNNTIEELLVVHFFGGNSDDHKPSKDQFIEVDDINLFMIAEGAGSPSENGRDISEYLIIK